MTDLAKFIVFKPVPGGYVYRAPNRWLFGARAHFLVTDAQKAAILAAASSSTRPVLWITGLAWIAQSAFLGTALLLWARHSAEYAVGLNAAVVMTAMVLSIYPAFVISRQLLLRRLRPILSTLRPTNERISNLEEREAIRIQAIRSIVPPISPLRLRIVRIASVVAMAGTLGAMIARGIDIYEPNRSKLVTLYLANANLYGLLNIVTIVAFGLLIVTFGRNSSQT